MSTQAQITPVLRRLDLRSGLGPSSSDITMTSSRDPILPIDCSHPLLLGLGQARSVLSLSCPCGDRVGQASKVSGVATGRR